MVSGGDPGRIIQCRRVDEPPADTPAPEENVQIPHRWGEVPHERSERPESRSLFPMLMEGLEEDVWILSCQLPMAFLQERRLIENLRFPIKMFDSSSLLETERVRVLSLFFVTVFRMTRALRQQRPVQITQTKQVFPEGILSTR